MSISRPRNQWPLWLISLLLFVGGCADRGEDADLGTCSQSPYNGSSLNLHPNRSQPSGYFNKSFDKQGFVDSFQASSQNIALALQFQGVRVFKKASSGPTASPCRYFGFLEPATEFASKKWQQSSSKLSSPHSQLFGLFSTLYSRNDDSGVTHLVRPIMILRENGDKWTLVHEMAHFLFARNRANRTPLVFGRELRAELNRVWSKIQRLKPRYVVNPSEKKSIRLARLYENYFKLTLELDRRGPLEEFAIESMLTEASVLGALSGVDQSLYQQYSLNYMMANASRVLNSYSKIIEKIRSQKQIFLSQGSDRAAEQMSEVEARIQETVAFIRERLQKSPVWTSSHAMGNNLGESHSHDPFLQHFDLEDYNLRDKMIESL